MLLCDFLCFVAVCDACVRLLLVWFMIVLLGWLLGGLFILVSVGWLCRFFELYFWFGCLFVVLKL